MPILDGIASILIGVVLGMTATLLANETKSLMMGESASPAVTASLCAIAAADAKIKAVNGMITVQIGPRQILAALSIGFQDGLNTGEIEDIVAAMEDRVCAQHPEIIAIFVKPQRVDRFRAMLQRRYG